MRVLAVDPGMATGMAQWNERECVARRFVAWELTEPLQVAKTVWAACASGSLDEIAMEDFHLKLGGRAMTTEGIRATIELIGMVRFAAAHHGVPLHMQWPEDAKAFSTNEKLARMGWTTPSKPDHMRSAARHLLLRLVRNGAIDGAELIR